MENKDRIDRSSDIEMMSDNDNSRTQIAHLETRRPVRLLSAAGHRAVASTVRVARPAPRTTLPDPENATGSDASRTFDTSSHLGYLDTSSGRVGVDGATKTKETLDSPSPAFELAVPPPHRSRPKKRHPWIPPPPPSQPMSSQMLIFSLPVMTDFRKLIQQRT